VQQNFQRTGTHSVPVSDAESSHMAVHPSKVSKLSSLKSSLKLVAHGLFSCYLHFSKLLKLYHTECRISSNLLKHKQSSRKTSTVCYLLLLLIVTIKIAMNGSIRSLLSGCKIPPVYLRLLDLFVNLLI